MSHGPALGRQMVVRDALRSLGQLFPPVQVSAGSHTPALERQIVPELRRTSGGHATADPVQSSATSQTPAAERHTVLAGRNASSGQSGSPTHVSATSQTPADDRHTVPNWKPSSGQSLLEP